MNGNNPYSSRLTGLSISIPTPEQDGDILELLAATFGQTRSIEEWRWRYRSGTDQSGISLIVQDDRTGKLVGHVGASPSIASAWGADIPAAQIIDVMTRPGWEGKGIFGSTFQAMSSLLRERGFVFVYAVPNHLSLPIFIRHFDWARLFNTRRWRLRLSMLETIARLGRSRALAHIIDAPYGVARAMRGRLSVVANAVQRRGNDFEITSAAPDGADEFWLGHRREESIMFSRSSEFLRGRLDERPGRLYDYYCLRRQGAIQAMAIGVREGPVLRLIDLQALGPDPVLARLLLAHLQGHSQEHGVHDIQIAGRHEFLLEDALVGYASTGHNPHVFCVGMLRSSPYQREILQPGNWSMFEIDTDAV